MPVSEPSWIPESEAGETLEQNWLLRLRRERFRSRTTGTVHDYYVLHLADVVNVVALTDDDQVILVHQFRAGSGRDSLETPGGLLEPGEDPLIAGPRELLEETGYAGTAPRLLGTVWSNPSLLTSRASTILITGARRIAEPRLDHGEELTVELVPATGIPRMIHSGEIDHSLAVAGLLWWLISELPGPLAAEYRRAPSNAQLSLSTVLWVMAVFAVACFLYRSIVMGSGIVSAAAIMLSLSFTAVGLYTVSRAAARWLLRQHEPTLQRVADADRRRAFFLNLQIWGR
jgi:8-oxo-dGTP pyrophosphatase MutT (NUDIX family)